MKAHIWMETLYDILTVNFSREKEKIFVPTLIIASPHDNYLETKATVAGLKRLCPKSQVVYLPLEKHIPAGELPLKKIKQISYLFAPFLENP